MTYTEALICLDTGEEVRYNGMKSYIVAVGNARRIAYKPGGIASCVGDRYFFAEIMQTSSHSIMRVRIEHLEHETEYIHRIGEHHGENNP